MPSNTGIISLCNRSLLEIGARAQISSINPSDGTTAGDACSTLFTPVFEQLARAARWGCLRKQTVLSLICAAQGTPENPNGTPPLPPQPFLYQYVYPSDCLFFRNIAPTWPAQGTGVSNTTVNNEAGVWLPNSGQIPFTIGYATDANNNPMNVILTNQEQAQGVYTVNQPNPIVWDVMFQQAFVSTLAAFLVPALSLHMPLMQLSISKAEGLIAKARAADGNEAVITQDHQPDWISARSGGAGINSYAGYGYGLGYSDISWPC